MYPIPSMYGMFTYIWLIFVVNVGTANVPFPWILWVIYHQNVCPLVWSMIQTYKYWPAFAKWLPAKSLWLFSSDQVISMRHLDTVTGGPDQRGSRSKKGYLSEIQHLILLLKWRFLSEFEATKHYICRRVLEVLADSGSWFYIVLGDTNQVKRWIEFVRLPFLRQCSIWNRV